MAKNTSVVVPWSGLRENLGKVLVENKYLSRIEVIKDGNKKELVLELKYNGKVPAVTEIKRVSRPSLRVYVSHQELPIVLG